MNEIEKRLLNIIQSDFPVTSKPYENLAKQLGLSEADITKIIEDLKKRQIIRRVGAIFDLQELGYKSTLCAMKISPESLEEMAGIVNSYSGVTHNYGREHEFNLWFTLIAENEEKIIETIDDIKAKTGVDEILNLPALNLFKINVDFRL